MVANAAVQHTRELQRILALPRRQWTEEQGNVFAKELSDHLRRPGGQMTLRAIQAISLYEACKVGGLFASIRVGGGKTLLSLLLPFLMKSRRPLLILPAKLIEKTKREMRVLGAHWPIPNFIRIISYELMGRAQAALMLEQYRPDLIVADEGHKLRNVKAAVTKRVARHMQAYPETHFVVMTGSPTKRSIKDYSHLLKWSLKSLNSPVPNQWTELSEWAEALDEKGGENAIGPGALLLMSDEQEAGFPPREAARHAFRRRLVETPGVVATSERYLGASLYISGYPIQLGKEAQDALITLRDEWETPDGFPLVSPLEVWRHGRELAMGFYYRFEPRPPDAWMAIRKAWGQTCREILSTNRRNLDSELQVVQAVDAGHYPNAEPFLSEWRRVKDDHPLNTVPVWIDNSVLRGIIRWSQDNEKDGGIIWCEHRAVAKELAKHTGFPYYAEGGQDDKGNAIPEHPNPQCGQGIVIASVASNLEGRNLQGWSKNLITSFPPNGTQAEQLAGRTHRDGQLADAVEIDVVITDDVHREAFAKACNDARYVQAITGQEQKLLYADIDL